MKEWLKRDPWWVMFDEAQQALTERQKQLDSDFNEVLDEMIRQEREAGKKAKVIASEYGLHLVTVYNVAKRAKERL